MINQFREQYGFTGVPIVFELRGKGQRQGEEGAKKATLSEASDAEEIPYKESPDLQDQEQLDDSYYTSV
jgi:hypothetical protein